MKFINRLVYLRKWRIVRELLALYCIEIPPQVEIGENFDLVHRGFCTVIHPNTKIGDRVKIYHNVTIGRADIHLPGSQSKMKQIDIGSDVILCPGSVVLGGEGVTRVGAGTILAANAVLNQSTGENEIWAGVPAKFVSKRR